MFIDFLRFRLLFNGHSSFPGGYPSDSQRSDELPVVLDPIEDDFGAYWGSIEHRQAFHTTRSTQVEAENGSFFKENDQLLPKNHQCSSIFHHFKQIFHLFFFEHLFPRRSKSCRPGSCACSLELWAMHR